jgi:hypothetical protein
MVQSNRWLKRGVHALQHNQLGQSNYWPVVSPDGTATADKAEMAKQSDCLHTNNQTQSRFQSSDSDHCDVGIESMQLVGVK